MSQFGEIPSSISIQQIQEHSQNIPSSVIYRSNKSQKNNDSVIFSSFIQTNQINLKPQSNSSKFQFLLNNNTHQSKYGKKRLKTELDQPKRFEDLKMIAKYTIVVQSDSGQGQQSGYVDEQTREKTWLGERNKNRINKCLKWEKEKKKIGNIKGKVEVKNIKQDQKLYYLSLTGPSQPGNVQCKDENENVKTILFRQISKNKELEDELAKVKQENKHLRSIINQVSHKKLNNKVLHSGFNIISKMKQNGKVNSKRRVSEEKKLNNGKQNFMNRRQNTEGNMRGRKTEDHRISKMEKKLDKFEEMIKNCNLKCCVKTKQQNHRKIIKKSRLNTENKQKLQYSCLKFK